MLDFLVQRGMTVAGLAEDSAPVVAYPAWCDQMITAHDHHWAVQFEQEGKQYQRLIRNMGR